MSGLKPLPDMHAAILMLLLSISSSVYAQTVVETPARVHSCARCRSCECSAGERSTIVNAMALVNTSAASDTNGKVATERPESDGKTKQAFEAELAGLGKIRLENFPLWVTIPALIAFGLFVWWAYRAADNGDGGAASAFGLIASIALAVGAYFVGHWRGHNAALAGVAQVQDSMMRSIGSYYEQERLRIENEVLRRHPAVGREGYGTTAPAWVNPLIVLAILQGFVGGYLTARAQRSLQRRRREPPDSSSFPPYPGA